MRESEDLGHGLRVDEIVDMSDLGRNMDETAIFTIRTDGADERRLTPLAGFPAWSPNGSRIAYSSSNEQLWVMNSDGTNAHQVTHCRLGCVEDFAPAWSPTGNKLVFVRHESGGAAGACTCWSCPLAP
jgi:Tol biopolymer transport system component